MYKNYSFNPAPLGENCLFIPLSAGSALNFFRGLWSHPNNALEIDCAESPDFWDSTMEDSDKSPLDPFLVLKLGLCTENGDVCDNDPNFDTNIRPHSVTNL